MTSATQLLRRLRSGIRAYLRPLPDGFDWESYVRRYEDLRLAGIDTKEKAAEHWIRHGRVEGRWATAPSYPTRTTLFCASVHSLYLRATGELVCWDDAGNDTILQAFDPAVHYGRDVYLGPVFNSIRRTLWEGRMPFPEVCQKCLVLRSRTEHSSFYVDRRVVQTFQIEPSYKCTLDCPGCVPLSIRRQASPRNLDPAIFAKILGDLRDSKIEVRAFDLQGHGEPLLHPRLWKLARMARDAFPKAYVTVTTNAQGVVRDEIFESGLDEVVCAIDGMSEATFQPYRVHGNFRLAYRFMRDVATDSKRRGAGIRVVWKYILFEHNSDDEHLLEAQRLAIDANVDEMHFVFTRNGPRSTRVQVPADVPILDSGLRLTFGAHEPDTRDLQARLAESRRSLADGDLPRAAELLKSIARNLSRFFSGGQFLTATHRRLILDVRQAESSLSEADRESIERDLLALEPV